MKIKSTYSDEEFTINGLEQKVIYNRGNSPESTRQAFEDAVKRFKLMVQKDGVLNLYRQKQSYEKPSEKKRRKMREAANQRFIMAERERLMASGEWEKRQKRKNEKRLKKQEEYLARKATE